MVSEIKQNQVIALEKGIKAQLENAITEAYKAVQRNNIFYGITKTYKPKDDDGEVFPAERTNVQALAKDLIASFNGALGNLLDIEATKDWNNCEAKADIKVDDDIIITQAPVTYLMWLEKQLVNVRTFILKLPTLPPEENWHWDNNSNAYVSDESETTKSRKIPRNHIKYEATTEHPAQVEVYHEDVPVGTWTTKKFSGALPASDISEMLVRVERLREAVIAARESANDITVQKQEVQDKILGYIFT